MAVSSSPWRNWFCCRYSRHSNCDAASARVREESDLRCDMWPITPCVPCVVEMMVSRERRGTGGGSRLRSPLSTEPLLRPQPARLPCGFEDRRRHDVVAGALLGEKLLMLLGRRIELAGRLQFGDDSAAEALHLGLDGAAALRRLALRVGVIEDRRAVGGADVRALAVQLGRVVRFPEHFQQVVVTDLFRIESDFHGLGVAGVAVPKIG